VPKKINQKKPNISVKRAQIALKITTELKSGGQLTVVEPTKTPRISAAVAPSIVVPAIVADGGDQAARTIAAPAPG
jgi:hypothetical protein